MNAAMHSSPSCATNEHGMCSSRNATLRSAYPANARDHISKLEVGVGEGIVLGAVCCSIDRQRRKRDNRDDGRSDCCEWVFPHRVSLFFAVRSPNGICLVTIGASGQPPTTLSTASETAPSGARRHAARSIAFSRDGALFAFCDGLA